MGKNMVFNLLEKGIEIVAWNRSPEPLKEVVKKGAIFSDSIDDLISKLKAPRVIWVMVTAGSVVDDILGKLADKLQPGDLVIDGGNSFYTDTLKRNKMLIKKGIHFMDVGTSGGIEGARHGACTMAGGNSEDYKRILPVLKAASAPDAYGLVGPVGAGHFAKTIHNGIEYGMMEAIGEGAAILKYSPFPYDLREVFRIYNNKSIIDSRLVNWALNELKKDPELKDISSVIGSAGGSGKTKGEGHWTVDLAKELGVDAKVIAASVKVRDNSSKDSEKSPNGFRNKVVAAMRWQFGQHPVKKQ